MVRVSVKWNKTSFDLDVDVDAGAAAFKDAILRKTGVPVDRQKLMAKGAWVGTLKDDAPLSGLKDGTTVTLIGTAEALPTPPVDKVTFVEDMTAEQQAKMGALLPAGLVNLGNTCYMNATVQCLRHLEGLKDVAASSRPGSLAFELKQLLTELDKSPTPVIPHKFVFTLRTAFPQFNENKNGRYLQQDADEFFGATLHSLAGDASNFPALQKVLGIETVETLTCEESTEEPPLRSRDSTFKLICNIQGSTGGTSAIDHITDGIKLALEGSIEKNSTILQRNARWARQTRMDSLPQVLCVQFMRFFWKPTPESMDHTGVKCKILRAVNFSETLDIFDFCTERLQNFLRQRRRRALDLGSSSSAAASSSTAEEQSEEMTDSSMATLESAYPPTFTGVYSLWGIVSHKGRSADSGHYMSYVRKNTDTHVWWKFDDDVVTETTTEDVLRLNGGGDRDMAYLCFYSMRL